VGEALSEDVETLFVVAGTPFFNVETLSVDAEKILVDGGEFSVDTEELLQKEAE
jgi:hypothetical protein